MTAGPSNGTLALENPFWRFACRIYAEPGIAPACVALQDGFGINVNVLLFAGWIGRRLDEPDCRAIADLVAPWTEQVVENLRRARRGWKALGENHPACASGRESLKSVELLSEQIVCAMLYRSSDGFGRLSEGKLSVAAIVAGNLELVLERAGVHTQPRRDAVTLLTRACLALA